MCRAAGSGGLPTPNCRLFVIFMARDVKRCSVPVRHQTAQSYHFQVTGPPTTTGARFWLCLGVILRSQGSSYSCWSLAQVSSVPLKAAQVEVGAMPTGEDSLASLLPDEWLLREGAQSWLLGFHRMTFLGLAHLLQSCWQFSQVAKGGLGKCGFLEVLEGSRLAVLCGLGILQHG